MLDGKVRLLQSASLTLCHSRMLFQQYYPTFDRFWCKVFLTDAFRFFGGACVVAGRGRQRGRDLPQTCASTPSGCPPKAPPAPRRAARILVAGKH